MSTRAACWSPLPADWRPERGAADVLRASTDLPPSAIEASLASLAPGEVQQAGRFVAAAKRAEYVLARALLRRLLARALSIGPRDLEIRLGPGGKPFVEARIDGSALEFNVSHSAGLVLVAIILGRRIGVDVERLRPVVDSEALARRFFSRREAEELLRLPVEARGQAFFACWTRKEAFLKATGAGIALGLDRFDVSLRPGEPPAVLRTLWDPREAARWTLADLEAGPEHAAAVAMEGPAVAVRCWEAAISASIP